MRILDEMFGVMESKVVEIGDKLTNLSTEAISDKYGSSLLCYQDKLEKGPHPSTSVDGWLPPEIEKRVDIGAEIFKPGKREYITDLFDRGYDGWFICTHVCSFLSGKEKSFGDNWDKQNRIAANMICRGFGVPEIYDGLKEFRNKTIKDYTMDSKGPIILASTIAEAMRRFPCEEQIESIKNGLNKKCETDKTVLVPDEVIIDEKTVVKLHDEKENHTIDTPKENRSNNSANVNHAAGFSIENNIQTPTVVIQQPVITKDEIRKEIQETTKTMVKDLIKPMVVEIVKPIVEESIKTVVEEVVKCTVTEIKNQLNTQVQVLENNANKEESIVNTKTEPEVCTAVAVVETPKPKTWDVKTGSSLNSPIKKLDPNKEVIQQSSGTLSSAQKKRFEDTFGKFLQGKSYQLNKVLGELIECAVYYKDENLTVTHIIDPGLMIGDEYYVVVPTVGDVFSTIKVHPSEVDILNKVFNSKYEKYRLTAEEHQRALSHMFLNQRIYSFFDMSNMGNTIRKLKTDIDKFKKFGQKLTCIINCIDNPQMCGRLTFSNFKNIDNFEVVSAHTKNHKVKSPFPGETLEELSGVKAIVKDDDITIVFQGQSKKYHIDRYDVM